MVFLWIPLKDQNPQEPWPTAIHNGKLYQLIENLEDEEWDLVITEIKDK